MGDVDDYLRQLDQLSTHFPLPHETLLAMAAEPLGSEAISAVYKADQMYGPGGMPYARLRKFLQSHLQQLPFHQRRHLADNPPMATGYGKPAASVQRERRSANQPPPPANDRDRRPYYANAPPRYASQRPPLQTHAFEAPPRGETRENRPAVESRPAPARKYGKGPNPCWVCGSDKHSWYHCEKKRKGKCAACGSEAHLTRLCAQRFYAHPSQFASNNGAEPQKRPVQKAARCVHCDCASDERVDQTPPSEPDEGEEYEEEQPHFEVEVPRASVQVGTTTRPPTVESGKQSYTQPKSAPRDLPCPLELPLQPALGALSLTKPTSERGQDTASSSDMLSMARQCLRQWPANWSSLLCQAVTHETLVVEPVRAPPQASLLHYPILVDNNPTTAMLDTGASHSFITRTLVTDLKLSTIRLGTSLTATDFGGARAVITETVTAALSLANTAKKWSFYVCGHAPAPVVLGLDAVLRWPLYLNPRDMCLHFAPEQPNQPGPTSDRGCSVAGTGDRGSLVLWPAPSSLTTSSYAIFDHNELRSPPEESGFLEESPPPVEEEAQRLLPAFPRLLSHDATSFTLARNSSVTASGFEELAKLKDFVDQLSPSFRGLVNQFSLSVSSA